jgi:hypothetical protein
MLAIMECYGYYLFPTRNLPPTFTPVKIQHVLTEQPAAYHENRRSKAPPQVMYKVMYIPANGTTPETFHQVMHLLSAIGDGPSHPECYDTALPTPHDVSYLFSQKSPLHGLAASRHPHHYCIR